MEVYCFYYSQITILQQRYPKTLKFDKNWDKVVEISFSFSHTLHKMLANKGLAGIDLGGAKAPQNFTA